MKAMDKKMKEEEEEEKIGLKYNWKKEREG